MNISHPKSSPRMCQSWHILDWKTNAQISSKSNCNNPFNPKSKSIQDALSSTLSAIKMNLTSKTTNYNKKNLALDKKKWIKKGCNIKEMDYYHWIHKHYITHLTTQKWQWKVLKKCQHWLQTRKKNIFHINI